MAKQLEKAKHLTLLGYGGKYIRKHTKIIRQKVIDTYQICESDIITYQIEWISSNYTPEETKEEMRRALYQTREISKLKRARNFIVLGCAFGKYEPVFKHFLGNDVFEQWDADSRRKKRAETLIGRYGRIGVNSIPEIKAKMRETLENTMMERYGVKNPTEIPEVARKVNASREATMLKKYGARNTAQVKHLQDKIQQSKSSNLSMSKSEAQIYSLLQPLFPDIRYNVRVDERYPYYVDFYIPSRDLFIEVNFDKSHHTHWYDETNVSDRHTVESWTLNAERIEQETGKVSRYRRCINTWTKNDVDKRMYAKANRLNYIVFWDGATTTKNKKHVYKLLEVYDWIGAGCPDSKDYHKKNTY